MSFDNSDDARGPEWKGANQSSSQSEFLSSEPVIPEHQLLRCIGRGSYGLVWLARSAMGMYRAVKIVYRRSFDNHRPFERELSGIEKFEPISRSHEGFIDVLQVGINKSEGYFYYIMEIGDDVASGQEIDPEEYAPRTLGSEILRQGRLPLEQCLRMGLAITDALAELHKQELVHRDIKPSNIIFVNGVPKLADIGLVAGVREPLSYVGTEGFIPLHGAGTPQGDLYGLGKVLYEASTGKDRQEFPDFPPEWSESPEYAGLLELNEVMLHSCHQDPAKRYASALDMHADLVLVRNGKSVRRLRILEQRWMYLKRVAAIAVVGLAICAVLGYNIYREWRVATDARQRQISANIAYGSRAMDSGDLLAALPYFAEGLKLDQGSTEREQTHRLRFGSVLAQCPKLALVWSPLARVDSARFSPDGKKFVFAESRGKAGIFDLETGQVSSDRFGRKYGLRSAVFSPDGRRVVLAGETPGYAATIWEADSLVETGLLPHPAAVPQARFSPDGKMLLTACVDGQVRIWNALTCELEVALVAGKKSALFACYSHDGRLIATSSMDGMVLLWHTNGQPTGLAFPHSTWVTAVGFSPDDQRLVTACYDHKAYVWDLTTGRKVSPSLEHDDAVITAEFSPDGLMLLTGSFDGTARLWDAAELQPLASNPILRHGERLTHTSFSPDGRLIISSCVDGTIRIWDLAGSLVPPVPEPRTYSRNASRYLTLRNNEIAIRDTETSSLLHPAIQVAKDIERAQLTPDGRFLLVCRAARDAAKTNYFLQVCASETGNALGVEIPVIDSPVSLALSDDGQRVAAYSGKTAQVWSARSGTLLSSMIHSQPISSVVFAPLGNLLVSTSGTNAAVWNSEDGKLVCPMLGHPVAVSHAACSSDGHRLLTCCSDLTVTKWFAQVWDLHSGKPIGPRLKHGDGVLFGCFSSDGLRVLTASEDHTAKVWETTTGKQIGLPLKHHHQVFGADFSPDGKWVATGSVDRTARVWDPDNTTPLTPPLRHLSAVTAVQFIPNQQALITTDTTGSNLFWRLPIDPRPVEYLSELADVLSGNQSTREGKTNETLAGVWTRLRAKHPEDFLTPNSQVVRWHEFQAEEAEMREEWFAAGFHLERLLGLRPEDGSVAKRLESVKARVGKVK